ncbi:hypothetical protein LSTR_LSTR007136 [Laodelphax striatellus]|uniref:V-SNARE coiled-coil homology domain-containing protein n=1 Tax=Laodelphax striatellus TaxID=195883 RepID=A0A482WW60_LAOST|nr:hypothetical protein LSTR_LSTR007136 [Laodelphax striatellus]
MNLPKRDDPSFTRKEVEEERIKKIEICKDEVDQVVEIMSQNIFSLLERDVELSELDRKCDDLSESANVFEKSAIQVEKKMKQDLEKAWTLKSIICYIFMSFIILAMVFLCFMFIMRKILK